jgi:hypothetical protein
MIKRKTTDRSMPISLHPMKLDEIIKAFAATPASMKPVMPKRSKSKSASKSRV